MPGFASQHQPQRTRSDRGWFGESGGTCSDGREDLHYHSPNESEGGFASGVEEAKVMGEAQKSKDAITFRVERAGISSLGTPMTFGKDGISAHENTTKRAKSGNGTTVKSKVHLG